MSISQIKTGTYLKNIPREDVTHYQPGRSWDMGCMFNQSVDVYNANVERSLANKGAVEMEEMLAEVRQSEFMGEIIDVREYPESVTPSLNLMSRANLNQLEVSKNCLTSSETARAFAWGMLKQSKRKCKEAMTKILENLSEYGELAENLPEGDYLNVMEELKKNWEGNSKIMEQCDTIGYWDFRYNGKKLMECL